MTETIHRLIQKIKDTGGSHCAECDQQFVNHLNDHEFVDKPRVRVAA